ncbi:hormone-sensitive lipase [Elysia marginata]|uniref:Hormone-sensitive lipase n=1 Tax=Elysia marginata TaxID=1093978 RepID=A0AAV4GSK4_9GAST|nr:hormone-sensitive lipase [Elysia marginata]
MMEFDSTDNPGRFFFALSRDLKSIALSNIQYFQSGKQSHHAKFHVTFRLLYEYLDIGIEPTYRELAKLVGEYDFSPEIKGNGYRSLLRVVQKCCLHLLQLSRYISSVRDSMLFRKKVYAKELESYVSALGQLRAVLYYALKLTQYCQLGHLFADEDQLNSDIAEALMLEVESLSQEFFYGRCLGFQYCESMQRPVQAMGIIMASLSEGYLESSQVMRVATSVFNSGKYILDPELRAKQMVKVTRTADIRFCQTFWNFPESPIMHQLPSFVCPVMEVNEILTLGPDAFELPLVAGGDTVTITPPCAHTGPGHVYTRLISAQLREGSTGEKIIVVGDSAGGNLAISTAMRAASFGIRAPDGAVLVYPCTVVKYTPSPARLLSLMDPLLPVGLMARCLAAYAGIDEHQPLASPTMHELHSDESLTRIRMGSFESTDNDWIIIAQNEEEVNQIRSAVEASPISPEVGKGTVVDTMEDSMTGGEQIQDFADGGRSSFEQQDSAEVEGSRARSSTHESEEEVEIFSQLLAQGSCVFPSEEKIVSSQREHVVGSHSPPKSAGPTKRTDTSNNETSAERKNSSHVSPPSDLSTSVADTLVSSSSSGKGEKSSGIALLQSRAKQMMAGAQNMFTSLSSYMPATPNMVTARSVMSSLASNFDSLSSSSLHTSRSSPVLASSSGSASTKPVSVNLSPASAPGCDLPDIETFTEIELLPDAIDSSKNDSTRSLPLEINKTVNTVDSDQGKQGSLPLGTPPKTDPTNGRDTQGLTVLELKSNAVVKDTDTSASESGPIAQETAIGVEKARRQSSPLTSSSSSGVFVTPYSTPISPPGGPSAKLPGAESNLSLSSVFLSDTSPQVQKEVQGLGTAAVMEDVTGGNDQNSPIASVDSPHQKPDVLSQQADGSLQQVSEEKPMDVVESPPETSLQSESVMTQPLEDRIGSGSSLTEITATTRPTPSVPLNIDKSLTHEASTESSGQSENIAEQCMPASFPLETSSPASNLPDSVTDSNKLNAGPTLDLSSIETEANTRCLQTLDMLSPETPVAPPSLAEDQNSQANNPYHQLSVICEVDTSCNSPASQAPISEMDTHKDQCSPSPQLTMVCEVDTCGDSPASLPSLPRESKELLEDALMSEDRVDTNENVLSPLEKMKADIGNMEENAVSTEDKVATEGSLLRSTEQVGMEENISMSDDRVDTEENALKFVNMQGTTENTNISSPEKDRTGCHLDPLLDDSVMFAKRLRDLHVPVDLHLVDDLPHGFLNFALLSEEARHAADLCGRKINDMLSDSV